MNIKKFHNLVKIWRYASATTVVISSRKSNNLALISDLDARKKKSNPTHSNSYRTLIIRILLQEADMYINIADIFGRHLLCCQSSLIVWSRWNFELCYVRMLRVIRESIYRTLFLYENLRASQIHRAPERCQLKKITRSTMRYIIHCWQQKSM